MPIKKPHLKIQTSYFDEDTNEIFKESLDNAEQDQTETNTHYVPSGEVIGMYKEHVGENGGLRQNVKHVDSESGNNNADYNSTQLLRQFRMVVHGVPQIESQVHPSKSPQKSTINADQNKMIQRNEYNVEQVEIITFDQEKKSSVNNIKGIQISYDGNGLSAKEQMNLLKEDKEVVDFNEEQKHRYLNQTANYPFSQYTRSYQHQPQPYPLSTLQFPSPLLNHHHSSLPYQQSLLSQAYHNKMNDLQRHLNKAQTQYILEKQPQLGIYQSCQHFQTELMQVERMKKERLRVLKGLLKNLENGREKVDVNGVDLQMKGRVNDDQEQFKQLQQQLATLSRASSTTQSLVSQQSTGSRIKQKVRTKSSSVHHHHYQSNTEKIHSQQSKLHNTDRLQRIEHVLQKEEQNRKWRQVLEQIQSLRGELDSLKSVLMRDNGQRVSGGLVVENDMGNMHQGQFSMQGTLFTKVPVKRETIYLTHNDSRNVDSNFTQRVTPINKFSSVGVHNIKRFPPYHAISTPIVTNPHYILPRESPIFLPVRPIQTTSTQFIPVQSPPPVHIINQRLGQTQTTISTNKNQHTNELSHMKVQSNHQATVKPLTQSQKLESTTQNDSDPFRYYPYSRQLILQELLQYQQKQKREYENIPITQRQKGDNSFQGQKVPQPNNTQPQCRIFPFC